jgi:hypothetical protein
VPRPSRADATLRLTSAEYAALAEIARQLSVIGQAEEEARVRAAMRVARQDPQQADRLLREAAARLLAQAPAYSHNVMRAMAQAAAPATRMT